MLSLRTGQSSRRYSCITATNPSRHFLTACRPLLQNRTPQQYNILQAKMSQARISQAKVSHAKVSQTKVSQTKLQHKRRGIHNISLPVHSEDTVYTRSSVAFSRKEAQARKEICALRQAVEESRGEVRQAVEERDAVIKQRDTLVKQKNETVKEKNGELQRLRQEMLQKSDMVKRLEDGGKGQKRADTMMELMGLRKWGREAYDPL